MNMKLDLKTNIATFSRFTLCSVPCLDRLDVPSPKEDIEESDDEFPSLREDVSESFPGYLLFNVGSPPFGSSFNTPSSSFWSTSLGSVLVFSDSDFRFLIRLRNLTFFWFDVRTHFDSIPAKSHRELLNKILTKSE